MPLSELIDYVKAGGGICAPLLLLALIWMAGDRNRIIGERNSAMAECKESNERLRDLSEKTLVLFTEIKGLLGSRHA